MSLGFYFRAVVVLVLCATALYAAFFSCAYCRAALATCPLAPVSSQRLMRPASPMGDRVPKESRSTVTTCLPFISEIITRQRPASERYPVLLNPTPQLSRCTRALVLPNDKL